MYIVSIYFIQNRSANFIKVRYYCHGLIMDENLPPDSHNCLYIKQLVRIVAPVISSDYRLVCYRFVDCLLQICLTE